MQHLCVVVYFLFVICLCIFAVVVAIVVLHLHLRAESKPVVAMPVWVSKHCKTPPNRLCQNTFSFCYEL